MSDLCVAPSLKTLNSSKPEPLIILTFNETSKSNATFSNFSLFQLVSVNGP